MEFTVPTVIVGLNPLESISGAIIGIVIIGFELSARNPPGIDVLGTFNRGP